MATMVAAKVTLPQVKDPEGEQFWIGVTEDAPFFSEKIGGFTFQRESFAIVRDESGQPKDDQRSGMTQVDYSVGLLVTITAEEMAKIADGIERRVCSVINLPDKIDPQTGSVLERGRKRGRVARIGSAGYQRVRGEEPIGRYLFVLPAAERMKHGRGSRPPTVIPPK